MRVAVVFHRFGPYHCARLEAASRYCTVTGIEIAAETSEYAWSRVEDVTGIKRVTLFSENDRQENSAGEVSRRMQQALSSCSPSAVAIPGWSNKAAIAALHWCARTRTHALLMSESTAHDEPRVWWREIIKRRIVGLYSTALVGGQRHIDYLADLSMPRDRIFTGYDVVDNAYFAREAEKVRSQPEARKNYGLPENYFLASARFIEKKNLVTLLRAYADYRATDEHAWKLVLLGDGPLRAELERERANLKIKTDVLMPGFKQYDELPVYYALAHAFVHPSTIEQWGLVVNEAVASGLPVIVSSRCGCAPELVHENVNGFTFDPADQFQLTSRLLAMSSMSAAERERFAQASGQIAAQHEASRFGEGLKRAAEFACSLPPKRAAAFDRALLFGAIRYHQ